MATHARIAVATGVPLVLAAIACVALYGIQLWANNATFGHYPDQLHSAIMVATGALQSVALVSIVRNLASTPARRARATIAVAAAALFVLSIAYGLNTNTDAAAYVAYARVPAWHDAYRTSYPRYDTAGFETIHNHWPELPPCVYGPLWLALDRIVARWEPTYAEALLVLRLVNVGWLALLLFALRRMRADSATLAAIAINPAIWFYYVVEAHNDLPAIALLVTGIAIAERKPLLGALVGGSAALVKISFVVLAALAAGGRRRGAIAAPQRLVIVLAAVLVASACFGGRDYFDAMREIGHRQYASRTDLAHAIGLAVHAMLAVAAAAAILYASVRHRYLRPAAYACAALSTTVYPWYFGWGIPYAIGTATFAVPFLVSLPAITHLVDPIFAIYPNRTFVVLDAVVGATLVWTVFDVLRRRWITRSSPT